MKYWALTALVLRERLYDLAVHIDDTVSKLALDWHADTIEQYEKILSWNDIKRRVVNLRVIADRMIANLSETERQFLHAYLVGESLRSIAERAGMSKSSVCRRINGVLDKCVRIFLNLGFSLERLNSEYQDIVLIRSMYRKLKKSRIILKKEAACVENTLQLSGYSSFLDEKQAGDRLRQTTVFTKSAAPVLENTIACDALNKAGLDGKISSTGLSEMIEGRPYGF